MTLFNYSKWVARQVTDPKKNLSKKIFIVGPAGSGKSSTALSLAKGISRWESFYRYGDFEHAPEFWNFDPDHIAVISSSDLVDLMVKQLPRHSIKVIDDCGTAEGINARRAMSQHNIDLASIYSTDRTDNGVTIYAVHDTSFADRRMRMLADEIIDLRNAYQVGPFRMGLLRKIRIDNRSRTGIRESRFTTYTNGEWRTEESIAVFQPDAALLKMYDELRSQKQAELATSIAEKYRAMNEQAEKIDSRPKCKVCGSIQLRKRERGMKCEHCGKYQ